MEDFVAYPSRWRMVLNAIFSAGLVVLGLGLGGALGPPMESRHDSSTAVFAVAWLCVIFFGYCCAIAVRRLFDKRELLRIGAAGVRWTPWSDQTIPWAEITDVKTLSVNGQSGIVLHLREPARFRGRSIVAMFARVDRLLTGGDFSITMTGTDRSFNEAVSAIARFRP